VALQELLGETLQATTVDFTAEHASAAIGAYRRFGKGVHPAGLNLGDCFSYALSASTGSPLLFKGNDFNQTDLKIAPIPARED
jgi:ribonuclease VapC